MQRLNRRLFSTTFSPRQSKSSSPLPSPESLAKVAAILSKPTWSIRSLLPLSPDNPNPPSLSQQEPSDSPTITREKLHHLLRLSALPLPSSPTEEANLLSTLRSQLHFVNAIRAVDASRYEPLVAIRDENEEEKAVTLEDVMAADRELKDVGVMGGKEWDPLANTKEKVGRYFVVEGEMGEGFGEQGVGDEVAVAAREVKKVERLDIVK